MTLRPEPGVFEQRLAAWGIRAVVCAAPSFVWAFIVGFRQPVQFAAMAAGVITYALAFAWVTSLPAYLERVESGDLGWSLRVAANTRAVVAPLMFFGPDTWLGALSLQVVQSCAGMARFGELANASSFGWTYATTMTQGALIAATMFLLALLILGGRSLLRRPGRVQ